MPLPEHAFTLHGGCVCGAVRYRLEIPAKEAPRSMAIEVVALHTRSLSHASSSVAPVVVIAPFHCVYLELLRESAPSRAGRIAFRNAATEAARNGKKVTVSMKELHPKDLSQTTFEKAKGSYLHAIVMEKEVNAFCSNCGTTLFIAASSDSTALFHVATLDNFFFGEGWLQPERHFDWLEAPAWVKDWTASTSTGKAIIKHPKLATSAFIDWPDVKAEKVEPKPNSPPPQKPQTPSVGGDDKVSRKRALEEPTTSSEEAGEDPLPNGVMRAPARWYNINHVIHLAERITKAKGFEAVIEHARLVDLIRNGTLDTCGIATSKAGQGTSPRAREGAKAPKLAPPAEEPKQALINTSATTSTKVTAANQSSVVSAGKP